MAWASWPCSRFICATSTKTDTPPSALRKSFEWIWDFNRSTRIRAEENDASSPSVLLGPFSSLVAPRCLDGLCGLWFLFLASKDFCQTRSKFQTETLPNDQRRRAEGGDRCMDQ